MEQTVHAVVCKHCQVRMTEQRNPDGGVQYFRCGSCHRWVSSTYTEIFESDAKFHAHDSEGATQKNCEFQAVKERLERFLMNLEGQDPYRVLGVSPRATPEEIKSRYREAALKNHPDRGGSAETMAELNRAYEQVNAQVKPQAVQRTTALPSQATRIPDWRPRSPSIPREQRVVRSRYAVPAAVLDRS